jgi:myo-inositol 2-dehydrogenase/D-chiro-inositol 1-dehydrogenase
MGAAHVRHFAALPEVTVVGVADADEQRARGAALPVGATPCPDLERLLALAPDAVVIAVPNVFHAQAAVTALARGVHVFCEKPMATSVEDARRVLHAVEQSGCIYQIGFNRRFAPVYAGARQLLAGGFRVFSATMKMNDGDMRTPAWFSDPRISGGFLYDTGIHLLDLARWLLGPPAEVRCLTRSSCYPDQDDAVLLLRFASEALVAFSTCGHATWTGPLERVELFGDHAAVVTEGFERRTHTPGLGLPAHTLDFSSLPMAERLGYAQEARAFADAVARGQPLGPTAEDALRAVEAVDACYRSAATRGAPVRLA